MLPYFKKLFGIDTTGKSDLPQELTRINQEMYKKSAELSQKNKTLLLLRKIDEIILSSITDENEIAQQVTSLLVDEAGFEIVSIFIFDKERSLLRRLARSELGVEKNNEELKKEVTIPLSKVENLMVQAVNEHTVKVSSDPEAAFAEPASSKTAIKCVFAYPLIIRDELLGSMVIALSDEEYNLSDYIKDLMGRLVQVIGIAIDNYMLYKELQDANEKLKALDKLKDEFVSLASHELRTPMTAVKSYLWMALQGSNGALNEKQKLYLDRAYSSVDRLIKLVNDMLNISSIESGRLTVEMEQVDIHKIAQEIVEEVSPRAKELSVNVDIAPSPTLPSVLADSDKIKEVLFNLIGNSLKFTPKDGKVTVSFSQNGDFIETKISDTGAGISEENLSKLFQKFSMLSESYTGNRTASGTGLGLYICRLIVEFQKGKIWASSEGAGKGSQFTFSLKIFNEEDLEQSKSQNTETKENIGIVHTQI